MTFHNPERLKSWFQIIWDAIFFLTVQDRRVVIVDYLKMIYSKSNDHITDDVTLPQEVKIMTPKF